MGTFTTFCFGTGESRRMPHKNIISQFSEACDGDFSVFDGPSTLGKEVGSNAAKGAEQIIEWLVKQKNTENNVNLTGFSRGSVTCIRIANELKKKEIALRKRIDGLNQGEGELLRKLELLKINLFANDPVAGLTEKSFMDSRVIPSNVANYVAIFQCDEMRRDFKPQDMTRAIIASPHTKVSMLPMYGNHSDNTKLKSDKIDSGAQLVWYSLYSFLTQHGTRFKDNAIPQLCRNENGYIDLPPIKESAELLALFSEHHKQRKEYLRSGQVVTLNDGIPVLRRRRSFNKYLEFYVRDSDFFLNQLERELFKIAYPQVFNYFFEHNQKDPRFPRAEHKKNHRQDIKEELSIIRTTHPELFIRLMSRGVRLDDHQQIKFGKPQGYYCIESCDTMQQMFPELAPDSVQKNSHIFQPLARLEKDLYRLSFRYLREKSELSPFSDRARSSLAVVLREKVREIINSPVTNQQMLSAAQIAQSKQELVLDYLEKEYIQLEKASHGSELRVLLKALLNNYGRNYQVNEQTAFLRLALSKLIYIVLTLIKEVISFVLNLGYLGGGVLGIIGTLIEDLGKRLNHIVGDFGSNIALNILKAPALGLAYLLRGVGYVIRQSFGLKPLAKVIDDALRYIRDGLFTVIEGKEVISQTNYPSQKENKKVSMNAKSKEKRFFQLALSDEHENEDHGSMSLCGFKKD